MEKATEADLPVQELDGTLNNVVKEKKEVVVPDYSAQESEANTWSWVTVSVIFLVLFAIGYFGIFRSMVNANVDLWICWLVFLLYLGLMGAVCFYWL